MPRGVPSLNEVQKKEIVRRVQENGERVTDLAKEFAVVPKTIYNLLGLQTNKTGALIELAKVKRENAALLTIIGSLVAESKLGEKRSSRKEIIMDYFSSHDSSLNRPAISKSAAAEKISVSRQSLYYQPITPAKDLALKQQIEAVLLEHKSYGYRRIAIALGVNSKRVRRVMKLFGLKAKKQRRRPRVRRDLSTINRQKNLIAEMVINQPNQAWVSDFTYLSYRSRFMYLATILDAFTREVIAWNISIRHNADLICEALISALNKREKSPQIFHLDQGIECRNSSVEEILKSKTIRDSMSKKSSPWQSGRQESFYQKFKFELEDPNYYQSQGELVEAIAIQIHYHHHKRIHSALKMPPAVFYQRFKAAENLKNSATPLHPYLQIGVQNNQISPQTNSSIDRLEAQNYQ